MSALLSLVFFSSRRRHTRCLSDWSSDVCSSDLFAWADPCIWRLTEVSSGHKEVPVTHLRKLTLDEIARRNYTEGTTRAYLRIIEDLARYFYRSPDQLGPEHLREY